LPVVESSGKTDNLGTDKNIRAADRLFQLNSFKRCATAESYISLSAGKHSSGKVYDYTAKGQTLAFVHGDGPCQADGILCESTQFFFLNLLFLFVVLVTDVAP